MHCKILCSLAKQSYHTVSMYHIYKGSLNTYKHKHNCILNHVPLSRVNKALTHPDNLMCQQNAGCFYEVPLALQQLPDTPDVSSVC